MTTLDTTPATRRPFGLGTFGSILRTLSEWNDARVTRKSLSRLSARELDDIGLNRGDIDMIAARGGRF